MALTDIFREDKLAVSAHFSTRTFHSVVPYEIGTPALDPPSEFNPTQYDHWESWMDECVKLGARTVFFTTHYTDGVCMWPSATSAFSLTNSPFYVATGIDVLADFCRAARQRGLKVGLYYCIEDKYYEEIIAPFYTYQQWTVLLLTELLTNYGEITYIFFDVWGDYYWYSEATDFVGVSYAQVDYSDIQDLITSLQPNCIFSVNDHVHVTSNDPFLPGQVDMWERPFDGVPDEASDSDYDVFAVHDPVHEPGDDGFARWFFHPDSPPDLVASARDNVEVRYIVQNLEGVYLPNWSPGPTGKMDPSTVALLAEMWVPDRTPVIQDSFSLGVAPPVALQTYSANWEKTAGDTTSINPSGDVALNGTSAYRRTDLTQTDYRNEVDFEYDTLTTNNFVSVLGHSNANNQTFNRTLFIKTADFVKVVLDVSVGGSVAAVTGEYIVTVPLVTGQRYRIVNEKRGDQIRGEFWTELPDNSMQMVTKLIATDSQLSSGSPGFGLSDTGSSTTGLHITEFRAYEFDTEAPATPTISFNGDDNIDFVVDADTKYVKIYRLEDDGFVVCGFIDLVADPGTTEFEDTEVGNSRDYSYCAIALDASWNASECSIVLNAEASGSGSRLVMGIALTI